ncbi:transporter [Pseudomonas sp. G2-4]|uniref:SphA family protein n=1 Tax=Pseudomonas sp. G2-4 TaxID=1506334 RepID=UPI0024BA85C4|nr:transporter [Pseudomonas sp. G2-4]WHS57652.1 transporter [Pseudomonas sp. G2-4]
MLKKFVKHLPLITVGTVILGLGLAPNITLAREVGTPLLVPVGGKVGDPVGANPPEGFLLIVRNGYSFGTMTDNKGKDLPVDVDVVGTGFQFHYVPGIELLGGSYRAATTIPLVSVTQRTSAGKSTSTGISDITLTPVSISWMLSPGIFTSSSLAFGVPTGSFDARGNHPNLGANVVATQFSQAFSYLRDGWNLSTDLTFSTQSKNKDTDYTSGNELLLNWTAMKDFSGHSIGLVGYGRWQMTGDRNDGAEYGGTTFGRSRQVAAGIGYTRQFGAIAVNANILSDFASRNALSGQLFQANIIIPLGN